MQSSPFGQFLVGQTPLLAEAEKHLGESVNDFQAAILGFLRLIFP